MRGAAAGPAAGVTLVEMLVALVIGMLIVIAAYASLMVSRQGFGAVSATAQLRDNARFATVLVQRLATQAGYRDDYNATYTQAGEGRTGFASGNAAAQPFFVEGRDAARAVLENGLPGFRVDAAVRNNSDVLVLRSMPGVRHDTGSQADGALTNCLGGRHEAAGKMIQSILFVAQSNAGEPALMCLTTNRNGDWGSAAQPLIDGVETFQILYGLNVGAGSNAPDNMVSQASRFHYVRADEVQDWTAVRSLRLGMVLRAAPGSGMRLPQEPDARAHYPLGQELLAADPAGGRFVSPDDGRIRQTVTFTVQLRNRLDQPLPLAVGPADAGRREAL